MNMGMLKYLKVINQAEKNLLDKIYSLPAFHKKGLVMKGQVQIQNAQSAYCAVPEQDSSERGASVGSRPSPFPSQPLTLPHPEKGLTRHAEHTSPFSHASSPGPPPRQTATPWALLTLRAGSTAVSYSDL